MKKSNFSFLLLFLFTLGCSASSPQLYGHRAEKLKKLPLTTLESPPKAYPDKFKNKTPIIVEVFSFRGNQPSGGYYYPSRGLDHPLYLTYGEERLEYPLFEFFCHSLLSRGYLVKKDYWHTGGIKEKPPLVLRGEITHFEIHALHQWKEGRPVIYYLGSIEIKVTMVEKKTEREITLAHSFKIHPASTDDILRDLLHTTVGKLEKNAFFISRALEGKEGVKMRKIRKGNDDEK